MDHHRREEFPAIFYKPQELKKKFFKSIEKKLRESLRSICYNEHIIKRSGEYMGFFVVLLALIFTLLGGLMLLAFIGMLGGAIIFFLASIIALIVLSKKGIFRKYIASEIPWQHYTAYIGRIVLIVIAVLSAITFIAEICIGKIIGII